jgi:hypothetical protein
MSGRATVLDDVAGLRTFWQEQDAVCSRDQLRGLGVDSDAVDHQTMARRWSAIGPHVVVLHRGPLTERARRVAALLHCGSDSALASWTALEEQGLAGWSRPAVHVIVPRGCAPPELPVDMGPIVVHESRRHVPEHVAVRSGLAVHIAERAAIDTGAWTTSDRTACGVLAAVVQQRLTTPARLLETLDQVGKVRRLRLMRATVADLAGGSQALSEIDFIRFCRRRGLPEPIRQQVRVDSRGRRRFLDAWWRLPNGHRLWVEIDGMGHLDVSRWYDDLLRAAEIQAAPDGGDAPVRLPASACRVDPDRVEAILRSLLGLVSRSTTPGSSSG